MLLWVWLQKCVSKSELRDRLRHRRGERVLGVHEISPERWSAERWHEKLKLNRDCASQRFAIVAKERRKYAYARNTSTYAYAYTSTDSSKSICKFYCTRALEYSYRTHPEAALLGAEEEEEAELLLSLLAAAVSALCVVYVPSSVILGPIAGATLAPEMSASAAADVPARRKHKHSSISCILSVRYERCSTPILSLRVLYNEFTYKLLLLVIQSYLWPYQMLSPQSVSCAQIPQSEAEINEITATYYVRTCCNVLLLTVIKLLYSKSKITSNRRNQRHTSPSSWRKMVMVF